MKVISYILAIGAVISFFTSAIVYESPLLGVVALISSLLMASIFYTLGYISERVDEANEKLDALLGKKSIKNETPSNQIKSDFKDTLPQKVCPSCGDKHDFDYPKCPKCKYRYED